MKKSNIILALILAWLSMFSLIITPGLAIKWPYFDQETYEIAANDEIKKNVYDLYDHYITFEYNATFNNGTYYNVSMLFIYKTADTEYEGNFTDISPENLTILDPILNIASQNNITTTEEMRIPDSEIYEIIFINRHDVDIEVTLTIMKEEIGTGAYYFGAVGSVLFLLSLLFILKKRSNYKEQNDEPEVLQE